MYLGRIEHSRASELAPIVFRAAHDGDAVARSIIDRLADELVAMAGALIRRLRMGRLDPKVVLAGGVFRPDAFYERLEQGIKAAAPRAGRSGSPRRRSSARRSSDSTKAAAGGAVAPKVDARLRAALEGLGPSLTRRPRGASANVDALVPGPRGTIGAWPDTS